MKLFFIFLILILIGFTNSYAQPTTDDSKIKNPEILLQLILRNSDGILITYIETDEIRKVHPLELNEFLDNHTQKEIIVKEGEKYEIIQWQEETENLDKKIAYSLFYLLTSDQDGFPKELVVVGHNSFQIQPGDTLTVYWTIIRLAN